MGIQDEFNTLWGMTISDIETSLQKDTLTFKLQSFSQGHMSERKLKFMDVSAFYYVKDSLSHRFDFYEREKANYLELTTLYFQRDNAASLSILLPKEEEWSENYPSKANVVMEIWSSVLLIEARVVSLDNQVINLK
ncbi:YxiG family protein [Sporosarcina sp. A2]|uniref:YxiG family protein n=1 Tax=Sporosarcina sp. A2 TaxID=3393449 RepID=UPI003D791032